MGILVEKYEIAKGAKADIYVKIDSVRAGMGEDGKITCSCGQWIGTESRAAGEDAFKSNVSIHIPDGNIVSNGGTLIDAVYPSLQKHYESMGYKVVKDSNNYGHLLEEKKAAEQMLQEQLNDGTE